MEGGSTREKMMPLKIFAGGGCRWILFNGTCLRLDIYHFCGFFKSSSGITSTDDSNLLFHVLYGCEVNITIIS